MKFQLAASFLAVLITASHPAAAQTPPTPTSTPSPPVVQAAGTVPAAVTIELAGTVTPAFVLARIRAAIDGQAARQPATTLDIHGITISGNLQPGSSLDALAGVSIGGGGAFANVAGKTSVHVSVAALPELAPVQLFYSDDPEYIPADATGVVFRGTFGPDAPARLVLYHVAAGVARDLTLVLQTTGAPAIVQRLGAAVGPSPAYAYVGQQTTARFLLARSLQESTLLHVAPDVPLAIPLGTLQPGDLLEAIDDLHVVSGGAVTASLVTSPASAAPADLTTLLAAPELADDTHGRRGVYALTDIPPIDLALVVGASDPEPVRVGTIDLPNERAGGRALGGDYGIARRVHLDVTNPTATMQSVFLTERTEGGGGATVTLLFDGEDAATTIPCVNDPTQPRLVRAFALAPGDHRIIDATFMTDGASSYPIALGLTTTPPLAIPAGACDGAG